MDYPVDYLAELREHKDADFKESPHSPLTPEQRSVFNGLSYYEPNPALEFNLIPTEFADKTVLRMMTTQNEIQHFQRWGKLDFTVDGQSVSLTLFLGHGSSQFFVPFTDTTNGDETYSGGRYVEVEAQDDGRSLRLDFNEAYNPYCAYNEPPALVAGLRREPRTWNCPIPPAENRLPVPIPAGEKLPVGLWVNSVN